MLLDILKRSRILAGLQVKSAIQFMSKKQDILPQDKTLLNVSKIKFAKAKKTKSDIKKIAWNIPMEYRHARRILLYYITEFFTL